MLDRAAPAARGAPDVTNAGTSLSRAVTFERAPSSRSRADTAPNNVGAVTATSASPEEHQQVGDGIELCFSRFGDPTDPPLLLVMGLGMQMVAWDDALCADLAGRGLHVIRFDNRDCGRSTRLNEIPPPGLWQLLTRRFDERQYVLGDMARDAAGLLDALRIERAHVVGASLGGMIAQTLAARHPRRVLSLTSIMSNTGHRRKGTPAPGVLPILLAKAPKDQAAAIERTIGVFETIGSPGYPTDPELLRAAATVSLERGANPRGTARQLAAILKSGDRTRELNTIVAPTLVIHGSADRLIRPSGGYATVKAIPNASLITVQDMGHDLPRALWPRLLGAISDHVNAAETAASQTEGAPT